MNILEWLKVVCIGIVEGLTEWLPISSTGHMILLNEWLQMDQSNAFMEMFFVVIQLGAIGAVVTLYFQRLNPFSPKKNKDEKQETWHTWFKVLIGVLPAAIFGFLLDDWLNNTLYNAFVVSIMLVVYGVAFILVERRNKKVKPHINSIKDISYSTALFIGLFQTLSLIPGTSRSGATILGGIILGASRSVSAEFSFFLSIPVMFGASALKLFKFGFTFTMIECMTLIIGMIVAYITSILTIKLLLRYIKTHDFTVFGWYRIALGIIVILYFVL
jgi:undecaprenyl-diphosphatase